jgi:hypothetical protein
VALEATLLHVSILFSARWQVKLSCEVPDISLKLCSLAGATVTVSRVLWQRRMCKQEEEE